MGGGFGTVISDWLVRFLGQVGTFFLFLFVGISRFLWYLNPPLAGQSLPEIFNHIKLNIFKKERFATDSIGLGEINEEDIGEAHA